MREPSRQQALPGQSRDLGMPGMGEVHSPLNVSEANHLQMVSRYGWPAWCTRGPSTYPCGRRTASARIELALRASCCQWGKAAFGYLVPPIPTRKHGEAGVASQLRRAAHTCVWRGSKSQATAVLNAPGACAALASASLSAERDASKENGRCRLRLGIHPGQKFLSG